MRKDCPKCKGSGSILIDYKDCKSCGGTGYQNSMELGKHFKGISSNAKARFELDAEQDIPCEVCNGKGQIEVFEKCDVCNGKGIINSCSSCGKTVNEGVDICEECLAKMKKEEEIKKAKKKEKATVYVLDSLCEFSDLDKDYLYKGKITRVEHYGVFVSLNNQVWGLMRCDSSGYNVGDEVIVRITSIKRKERQIDLSPSYVKNYKIKTLNKSIKRTKIEDLDKKKHRLVKVSGEVLQIQQTSGPTIFTITDESGVTWVAAFSEAGVRSYPEIEIGDIVEVLGDVNEHSGKTQIESQSIRKLTGLESKEISQLIEKALDERAEPDNVDFLIESDVLNRLKPKMREAAKKIRRAILDGRSILVRHHADADGICAGVAMEKAVVPLIDDINPDKDATWHYFKRSPSKAPFYELEDVVKDLSFALEDLKRFGQKLPLIVLLDNGSTEEDIVALMQAKIYDIEIVVIDHHYPGELLSKEEKDGQIVSATVAVDEYVDTHVNPYLVGGDSQVTAGALASEVAHIINPEVKDLIKHLPAIAVLGDRAECDEVNRYIKLAGEKGYSKDELRKISECVDFEAYFLRFMNGRGIMDTILAVDNLDKHEKMVNALYKEYDKRVQTQLKAALPNVKKIVLDNGINLNVIDVEKFAHKFTFPAPGKTCGFIHDKFVKELGEDKPILTLGHGPDFAVVRATNPVNQMFNFNVNNIITDLQKEIPQAGIDGGGHECAGSIKYVEGLGKEVLNEFVSQVQKMK